MNSINTNIQKNNIYFNGKIITKGQHWPPALKEAFNKSKAINNLATGENIVIGSLITSYAPKKDIRHFRGEKLYKLSIEVKNPKDSLLKKFKSFLGLNSYCVNRRKHSEHGLGTIIKYIETRFLKKLTKVDF